VLGVTGAKRGHRRGVTQQLGEELGWLDGRPGLRAAADYGRTLFTYLATSSDAIELKERGFKMCRMDDVDVAGNIYRALPGVDPGVAIFVLGRMAGWVVHFQTRMGPVLERRKLNLKAEVESSASHFSCKRLGPGGFNLGSIGSTCTALPCWSP